MSEIEMLRQLTTEGIVQTITGINDLALRDQRAKTIRK